MSDTRIEIPDGEYLLVTSRKFCLLVDGGKSYLVPITPKQSISDVVPKPLTPPAPPSKVAMFIKERAHAVVVGLLIVAVLVLAFWRFHPSPPGPGPDPDPKPTPRPPWVPPNPPSPPSPTPVQVPKVLHSVEEPPTAEPGPPLFSLPEACPEPRIIPVPVPVPVPSSKPRRSA